MAMQETGPVTKLRILIPDARHVAEKAAAVFTENDIPLRVRKNGGTHLEFPKDDPGYPFTYTLQKNGIITEMVAGRRFPVAITTTDRYEDYLARAFLSKDELPTSVSKLAEFEVYNPLLRVRVLVRQDSKYNSIADFNKGEELPRVVTSYLGLAEEYFNSHNTKVTLERSWGKEEELVHDGDADAVVVVVDKGTTMRRFKLRELGEPVMGRNRLEGSIYGRGELKLVLICNPDLLQDQSIQLLVDKLMGKLQSNQGIDENPEINYNPELLLPFTSNRLPEIALP